MADNLSDYAEKKTLEHMTGKATWTKPTNTYLGLFTVTPSDAGGGTEVADFDYERVVISWGNESGGVIRNNAAITFPQANGGDWDTIVAIGIFDAITGGNLIAWGPSGTSPTIEDGDVYQIASAGLGLTLG